MRATLRAPVFAAAVVLFFCRLCLAQDFQPDVHMTAWNKQAASLISYFDQSSHVLAFFDTFVALSTDDGASWTELPLFKDSPPVLIEMDPFFPERAFAFSPGSRHYVTNDRGQSWLLFEMHSASQNQPMSSWNSVQVLLNRANKDYVLLTFGHCTGLFSSCESEVFYSKDGLKSNPLPVLAGVERCVFARSNLDFDPLVRLETMFCSRNDVNSFGHVVKSNLLKSTDFFQTHEVVDHIYIKHGQIIDVRVESAFLVVVLKKDKFNEAQVTLVVSKDAATFRSADLDFEITYGAIIFLKSTPVSLRLSLFYQGRHTKEEVMYFSDSSGLKFRKIANVGLFSASSSNNVDGLWFADVRLSENSADMLTRYSFDDCKTWEPLRIIDDESCKVQDGCSLHFVPEIGASMHPTSMQTPDILVAPGAKGSSFNLDLGVDTYVSRDGGASWKLAVEGLAMPAYADRGNVLVLMSLTVFGDALNKLHFSLDQGKLWSTYELEVAVSPVNIVTLLDSSTTKLVVLGRSGENTIAYSVDFKNAFGGKTCTKDDFENVNARVSAELDGPTCVHGHKSAFSRRKQDAQCLVKAGPGAIETKNLPCECTAADFECSPYFKLSDKGACVPVKDEISKLCQSSKKKSVKIPHQQQISGNDCSFSKSSKSDFIAETEFDCKTIEEEKGDYAEDAISVKLSTFEGVLDQYSYVESNNRLSNILVHTNKNVVHASNNGGSSFVDVPVDEDILFFLVGPVTETAVLVSLRSLYFSTDGGNTFTKLQSPGIPTTLGQPVLFHPVDANKFIFIAADQLGLDSITYYTEDGGASFKKMPISASVCEYVADLVGSDQNLMYCLTGNSGQKELVSSTDYFQTSTVLFKNVLAFASKPDFVLVATVTEEKALQLKITSDGTTFADADFPTDFTVDAQTTYTILESHRHSVFLHITTEDGEGREFGSLVKSNSNGTSYVLSLENVNRDHRGFVDYDKIDILEGVLVANTVRNPNGKGPKELKTQMSFNDGSQWSYLTPPSLDSEGKKYSCIGSPLDRCSLNLHGFTERPDYRDTFSSASAIGYLIGVGNVGESLKSYEDASTFISADGGVTWKEISKGVFLWEYGDRGTILLLVNAVAATDVFLFSTDDGNTWQTHKFADKPVKVRDLATVPTDTARKFVIFAEDDKDASKTLVYSLDFTNFYKRQCQIDLDHPLNDDFEYWTPRHPESADNCLFGHESHYLRRAQGHYDCFIGAAPLSEGMKTVKNCTCSRRDYECDYNYFRDTDGTCKLVKGLSPQDRKEQMCSKPGTFEYFEPTGYRKIPLSTCVGGKTFDSWDVRPCPGHEKEFNEEHGRNFTFGKLLLLVLLPSAVFFGATWFVYERGIKRNGGFARLGQIRLDEDDNFQPIEENNIDVAVNRIVRGGIVVIAGIVAAVKTVRKIDRKLLENAARIAFGRRPGRRDYVRVPDDEDELFGNFEDNYEDELGEAADVNFEVDDEPDQFDDFASSEPAEADARLFDIDDEESQPLSESEEPQV
ncbi:Oligoxyloglucan reducing end-specific cellobiohydrolase [Metschnikowia bicuspidata var. bicuspidata NRRL YB-4993]|uniref:Oligoxyloglucan reducing end-specific cellobiohydrolase n=1 Tax=Metschnikowia bicuspidata var. bicuspidata NRRL YB-4993 TaxID=869754 RepID=A0A1A0H9T3_9ASCO|nr:Oligoxyloglucan reducing end-specific cellobiohydrolase [Metschnikowia bicuspidata var. bicuspidata NRRL YB-4993]OBA20642.1 Oligoxyloglucan reducing end-specific cellobiohydrolase [Metschnikowia bicuspidata var. bicuspidata NRRL YB-4993]